MSEKIVEAVAKSIFKAWQKGEEFSIPDGSVVPEAQSTLWREFVPAARAAIEALRNPSKEMIEAGYNEIHDCIDHYTYDSGSGYTLEPFAPTQTWQAMIDAALGKKP